MGYIILKVKIIMKIIIVIIKKNTQSVNALRLTLRHSPQNRQNRQPIIPATQKGSRVSS